MTQPELFPSRPRPTYGYQGSVGYQGASPTSKAAAKSLDETPALNRLEQLVLDTLASRGPSTDEEIEDATTMRHQTASARRRALVLKGLVLDSGETRETSSGRKATVWRLA